MAGTDPRMKLSQLIHEAQITSRWNGAVDPIITSIVEDSRQVKPGACFVAMRGTQVDGHSFVDNALRAGASAVISERAVGLPDSFPNLRVENARGVAGRLAAVLCGLDRMQREGRLKVVGITGTNGKSTFCYLLRAILNHADYPTALIGTIQYDLLSRTMAAPMTTPPATTLVTYLAEAVRAGATHAVMEVSSHALDQGRCDGVRFDVGVFSNLTGDHQDYHKNMESYKRAKKRFFDGLHAGTVAVVNKDDPAGEDMIADCPARIIRYGILENSQGCQLRALVEKNPDVGPGVYGGIRDISASGTRFDLLVKHPIMDDRVGSMDYCEVNSPLIGAHNVRNSLAAVASALILGVRLEEAVAGLVSMRCVPGRLQRISVAGTAGKDSVDPNFTVLVDYAHTDDALANVLSALRPLASQRLIVMFGCGGDRDNMKRPRMAGVAAQWADRIVVTSDNPRTEDPLRIIDDILAGFQKDQLARVHVQPDRRRAIAEAIAMADQGDIVLLAGKGHEDYQEIGRQRFPFDDATIAAEVLEKTRKSGQQSAISSQQ